MELWTDWPLTPVEVESFTRAASEVPMSDRTEGKHTLRGVVSVDGRALWVSVIVTGAERASDAVWAVADQYFRDLWTAVHHRVHAPG